MEKIIPNTSQEWIRWHQTIEKYLPQLKNKFLIEATCQYYDFIFESESNLNHYDFLEKLKEIEKKLEKMERVEIVDKKYFNLVKMCIEYKTIYGDFVEEKTDFYPFEVNYLIDIFGINFMKEKYPIMTRIFLRKKNLSILLD